MAARIAAEDSRKLTLPQTADAYKVELPADFKPPEGVKFAFQADDPLLSQARSVAHELGIPQEGFSKLLGREDRYVQRSAGILFDRGRPLQQR